MIPRFIGFLKALVFLAALQFPATIHAQDTIKVRQRDVVVFFPEGRKTDTLDARKTYRYIFIVSNDLKPSLKMELENCRLLATASDSVYILEPMRHFKYIGRFTKSEKGIFSWELLLDGAVPDEQKPISIMIRHPRLGVIYSKELFLQR